MTDKIIKCIDDLQNKDCQGNFNFSAMDQEFFAQKGFPEPKRCPSCRQVKKNRVNSPFNKVLKSKRQFGDY